MPAGGIITSVHTVACLAFLKFGAVETCFVEIYSFWHEQLVVLVVVFVAAGIQISHKIDSRPVSSSGCLRCLLVAGSKVATSCCQRGGEDQLPRKLDDQ